MLDWLTEGLRELAGEALGWAIIIGILVILTYPIYLIAKKFKLEPKDMQDKSYGEHVWQAISWRPTVQDYVGSPAARELNDLSAQMRTVYQWALGIALLAATVFIVYFFARLPDNSERSFLEAFFGMGYLAVLIFCVAGIVGAERDKRNRRRLSAEIAEAVAREPQEPIGMIRATQRSATSFSMVQIAMLVMVFVACLATFLVVVVFLRRS